MFFWPVGFAPRPGGMSLRVRDHEGSNFSRLNTPRRYRYADGAQIWCTIVLPCRAARGLRFLLTLTRGCLYADLAQWREVFKLSWERKRRAQEPVYTCDSGKEVQGTTRILRTNLPA
jgi:hypothetical protein